MFGKNGEEKIINEIKNLSSNTKIMITKYLYNQEYKGVHEYIQNNYKKVDTILNQYEIYK